MFHGAKARHRELLPGLPGSPESCVVGLHDDEPPAPVHGVPDQVVVGDLEADHVRERHPSQRQDTRCPPGEEVVGHVVGEPVHERFERRAERQVLGEGDRVALHVHRAERSIRIPDQGRVAHVPFARPTQHRPDQDRLPDRARCPRKQRGRRVVGERVEVAAVLGPQDELRLRNPAGRRLGGQPLGLGDVVFENRPPLTERVQPGPGHVALHRGDDDAALLRAGRQGHGQPHERHEENARRERPRPQHPGTGVGIPDVGIPDVGIPGTQRRPGAEGGRRQQGTGQGDHRRHQRGAAQGGDRRERAVALAERHATPREAAKRHPAADGLREHPHTRDPDRPGAQSLHEGRRRRDERQHQPLGYRQDEPPVDAGNLAPSQQRNEKGQAEKESEQVGPQQSRASHSEGERANSYRRQEPPSHRREGRRQSEPGGKRRADPAPPPARRLLVYVAPLAPGSPDRA